MWVPQATQTRSWPVPLLSFARDGACMMPPSRHHWARSLPLQAAQQLAEGAGAPATVTPAKGEGATEAATASPEEAAPLPATQAELEAEPEGGEQHEGGLVSAAAGAAAAAAGAVKDTAVEYGGAAAAKVGATMQVSHFYHLGIAINRCISLAVKCSGAASSEYGDCAPAELRHGSCGLAGLGISGPVY
jgi:hypothetical protein